MCDFPFDLTLPPPGLCTGTYIHARVFEYIRSCINVTDAHFEYTLYITNNEDFGFVRCHICDHYCAGCTFIHSNDGLVVIPRLANLTLCWPLSSPPLPSLGVFEHPSMNTFLPEQPALSLPRLLSLLTQPEPLTLEDSWHCTVCKEKRSAIKRIEIWYVWSIYVQYYLQ